VVVMMMMMIVMMIMMMAAKCSHLFCSSLDMHCHIIAYFIQATGQVKSLAERCKLVVEPSGKASQ
jgi:hypothetical protein